MPSEIQEFFKDKKVLVTGATGFLGKVLVEKLLRSTEVKLIYMLVRPKKGKSVFQRAEEYFDDELFSRVKAEVVGYQDRVATVEGDITVPGLGVSAADSNLLQTELDVIFHGAATVNFDESLDKATYINVRGTKEVFLLAKKCANLKAMVHLSTAYANCTQSDIKEEFFEPPLTGDNAIQLAECLSDSQAAAITKPMCGDYPNSYTFTKAVGEHVVKVYGQGLPVAILRPAIVVATANEPIKGWIDNIYGPTGVQVGVGAGILRAFQVNVDYVAELVPVDMVVNAVIACAWETSKQKNNDSIPIYNYVSSCQNPLYWGQFIECSLRYGRQSPSVQARWYYMTCITQYWLIYLFYQILLHLLPAMVIDSVLILTGKKAKMMAIYKKVQKFSRVIAYFSTRKWTFQNSRVLELWGRMSPEDHELFNFDISSLHWDTFLKNTVAGIRKSFFHDTPDTIPAGRRKQLWFMLLHYTLVALLIFAVVWLPLRIFSVVGSTCNHLLYS